MWGHAKILTSPASIRPFADSQFFFWYPICFFFSLHDAYMSVRYRFIAARATPVAVGLACWDAQ